MQTDKMIKEFKEKYVGEIAEDLMREVDPETAKAKYLIDESMEYLGIEINTLKDAFKSHFDTKRDGMNDKAERYALDANILAHNLVYEALILWKLTEDLLPKD